MAVANLVRFTLMDAIDIRNRNFRSESTNWKYLSRPFPKSELGIIAIDALLKTGRWEARGKDQCWAHERECEGWPR